MSEVANEMEIQPAAVVPGQFLHEGQVLGVRSIRQDLTTYGGFKNPVAVGAEVFAPDWSPEPVCGQGLHFIPWGIGHRGQDHGFERPIWQVIEPIGDVVSIDGKCKSRGLRIVHTGTLSECMAMTHEGRTAYIESVAEKSATGDSSSAAATGYSSSAAATGYGSSAAATGDSSSAAATGYGSSAAATGDRSSAAATGDRSSAAATGDRSSAAATGGCSAAFCTSPFGKAKAGPYSCIALALRVEIDGRYRCEMRCAEVGCGDGSDGKLKADVFYKLNDKGQFILAD